MHNLMTAFWCSYHTMGKCKSICVKNGRFDAADNYGFRPVAEEMCFKEQLLHMADNMKWLSSAFLFSTGKNEAFDTTMDKTAVIKILSTLIIRRYLPIISLVKSNWMKWFLFLPGPWPADKYWSWCTIIKCIIWGICKRNLWPYHMASFGYGYMDYRNGI